MTTVKTDYNIVSMEDPNTSGDKTKQINQNQVIDKGQRIRPHQTSPIQDRGEENSQDCYEGTNHLQRKKATVTLLNWTLNTYCLATLLCSYCQLYL